MHCLSRLSGAVQRTLSVLVVAALFAVCGASAAWATPSYPPRVTCALAASVSGSGVRIAGTGFTARAVVTLRMDHTTLAREATDSTGSFGFGLRMTTNVTAAQTITASDRQCSATVGFSVASTSTPPPPLVQPPTATNRLPGFQVGSGVFIAVLAAVVAAAIGLLVFTTRLGHRNHR